MASKFVLKQAKNKKIYFNLLAPNGEIVLTSQMYASKATARKGVASVQANCKSAAQFKEKQSTGNKHCFSLTAKNHQVIGNSQMYSSKAAMKNGIKSVMKTAPKAKTDDLTI